MLISVHVPKCAGTSFRFILQEQYGDRLWPNYGKIHTRGEARAELVPAGTTCIHGHFLADAFDELYAERTYITWLRDPVDRLASAYHYFRRIPDWQNGCCRELHERKLSLVEFAWHPGMRNEAARYLVGKPLAEFAFVGVSERFAESLTLLAATLGWTTPVAPRHDNFNPEQRQPRYEVAADEREQIRAANELDTPLYEEALARLERSLAGA